MSPLVQVKPEQRKEVAMLPARMAHALHGLLVAVQGEKGPPTAAEACLYDFDALSVQSTAQALHHAAKRGYCFNINGCWWPTNRVYDIKYALEERSLADEDARDRFYMPIVDALI